MELPETAAGLATFSGDASSGRAKATLFYHLAELLVWGQSHTEIVEVHPEFGRLLRDTANALANAGVLESGAA
jgi:hypothetical protein